MSQPSESKSPATELDITHTSPDTTITTVTSSSPPTDPEVEGDDDASYINPNEIASSITATTTTTTADDIPDDDDLDDVTVEELDGEENGVHMSSSAAHQAAQVLANDDSVQGFFEHKEAVYCVGTYGDYVVSGDGQDQAYVWSRKDGEIKYHLTGHTDSVIGCDFSYDGKMVATASMDGTVRVHNMSDGSLVHSLEGPGAELEWFEWHHAGHVILAGSADHTTWMWNAMSGQLMQMFTGHTGSVLTGGFSHDGKVVVTASEDSSIFIWSPKTGKPILHITDAHEGPVTTLTQHPSQRLILSGSVDASVALISAENGKVLSTYKGHTDSIEGAGFSNTFKYAATGSVDGQLKIWDLGTSQNRLTCAHPDAVTHLVWHPNDPLIFTSCCDRLLRMWDARSGRAEKQWAGHQDNILTFALTTDLQQIVSGGDDSAVLVFNI